MPVVNLENRNGGQNRQGAEHLLPNESSILHNGWCIEGNVVSIPGRVKWNDVAIPAVPHLDSGTVVNSLFPFYKTKHRVQNTAETSAKRWLLASCGEYVWLWVPEENEFRPIWQTIGSERATFTEMNGRCYMGREGIMRWDGFYYTIGTVSCTGNTTLTGSGVTWDHVDPGDMVFVRNGATRADVDGPNWVISVAGSNITLAWDGPDTGGNQREYIIVRMHSAGVQAAPEAPKLQADNVPSAHIAAGTYQYRASLVDAVTGAEYPISGPLDYSITVAAPSSAVSIDVWWITRNTSVWQRLRQGTQGIYNCNLRIYRTKAGGSDFYWLCDVDMSKYAGPGEWRRSVYRDESADTGLTVAYPMGPLSSTYKSGLVLELHDLGAAACDPGAGTRYYRSTLYNENTDTEGPPSPPSAAITTATGHYPTIRCSNYGGDRQATHTRLYRTADGGEAYYLVAQAAFTPGSAYVDIEDNSTPDSELVEPLADTLDHLPAPEKVTCVDKHAGRVWAFGDGTNCLYFSTLGDPEHWPSYEVGVNDMGPYAIQYRDASLGGFIRVGDPGDSIVAITSDLGAHSENNKWGNALFILTRRKSYYLFGRQWGEWQLVEGPKVSCASGATLASWMSSRLWLSRDTGPVAKTGLADPKKIHEKLFPTNTLPFREQVTAGGGVYDYFNLSCGVVYDDYFTFTWCQSPSETPNRMAQIYLPTGAVNEIGTADYPCECYSMCVLDGEGDNGELLYGDGHGQVWRLFAQTGDATYWDPDTQTGVQVINRTGPLNLKDRDDERYSDKKPSNLVMSFRRPSADQEVTAKVFVDCEETNPVWSSEPQTLDSGGDARQYIPMETVRTKAGDDLSGKLLQVEWTGEFTRQVVMEGIGFDYDQAHRNA